MSYYEPSVSFGFVGALAGIFMFIPMIISLLIIISMWKIFVKCGKPGWAAIVPIYNIIVLLEIVGKGPITILLLLIPFYNIYVGFTIYDSLAKKFGKTTGFAILMIFFPYVALPILAFSKNSQLVDVNTNYNNQGTMDINEIDSSLNTAVEPIAPAAPVMPAVEPVAPAAPVIPAVEPVAPAAPVMPAVEPVAPAAPVMPAVEPVAPAAPVMPTIEPVAPAAPVMPTVEPVAPAAPVMPTNSIEGQNTNGQF